MITPAPRPSGDFSTDLHLLNIDQACERLNVSESTLRRLVRSGQLPVVKLGNASRYRPSDIAALVNANAWQVNR